jgi:hypothetical protein
MGCIVKSDTKENRMKKTIILFAVCVLALSSCASSSGITSDGRAATGGMPQFVRTAINNAPKDALIGVGTAKIGAAGLGQAQTIAEARARAGISRQLNTIVRDALTDFTASSEVNPKDSVSYQESITMTLSKSTLTGVSIIEQDRDGDNNYWVVTAMGKTSVAREINQAQAAARLAVPQAQALDALARMDKAFDKIASEPIGVSNK